MIYHKIYDSMEKMFGFRRDSDTYTIYRCDLKIIVGTLADFASVLLYAKMGNKTSRTGFLYTDKKAR